MAIRPATETDVDAVRRVAERSWKTDYADILTRETAEEAVNDWYEPETLAAELAFERTLLLVAERDDEVVGFSHATWSEDGNEGYILRLYTDPDHRREGIGRDLLAGTCTELADRGVQRVNAMVLSANNPGWAFYERFGFEYVEEHATTIGDTTYDERRYVHDDPTDVA